MLGLQFHYIFAHLIGDYLIQTDWMAVNKKKKFLARFLHILTYTLCMLITPFSFYQVLFVGLQHYLQDMSNFPEWFLKLKGSPNFARKPFAPWSIILCDNIFHILWMEIVKQYF